VNVSFPAVISSTMYPARDPREITLRDHGEAVSDNRRRFDPSLIHPIRQDETTSDGRRKACLSAPVALPDEQAL
jgi:hypothetical protein